MKRSISIFIHVVVIFLLISQSALAASETEQLIVFVQPGASAVDTTFQNERLPEVRKLADSMGVSVHVVDARTAAPGEVALTPLLVYQNLRGRSVYQGRSTTLKRMQNFIRTSRYVPQGKALNRREHIPVWQNGRTKTWAPLDNYAGEVTSAKGEIVLPINLQVDGAKGFIEVDTSSSITMGDPVLDEIIRGSIMLYTNKYPTAKFAIESVASDGRPITFGQQTAASIQGLFTLKGKTVPLTSTAEIEPIIADNGKPRLLIRSTFKIDLRVFNIEGADGPPPARHTLLFDANFTLKEKKN